METRFNSSVKPFWGTVGSFNAIIIDHVEQMAGGICTFIEMSRKKKIKKDLLPEKMDLSSDYQEERTRLTCARGRMGVSL